MPPGWSRSKRSEHSTCTQVAEHTCGDLRRFPSTRFRSSCCVNLGERHFSSSAEMRRLGFFGHLDLRDDDSVPFLLAGDSYSMASMLTKPGEVLVADRQYLRTVIDGQGELEAPRGALQRAFAFVDLASVISAALTVGDHSGPRLFGAHACAGADKG